MEEISSACPDKVFADWDDLHLLMQVERMAPNIAVYWEQPYYAHEFRQNAVQI